MVAEGRPPGVQAGEAQAPRALLWVMGDPGGNAFCLGLADGCRGRVYFWVHDEGPGPAAWTAKWRRPGTSVGLSRRKLLGHQAGVG